MTTAPFVFVTETGPEPGWRGFLRGVGRRLTWRVLLVTAVASALLAVARDIGDLHNMPIDKSLMSTEMWLLSGAVILACLSGCTLLAVLAADEAVARGAPRARAYIVAVACGSAIGAAAQYLIRIPLGLRTLASNQEFLVRVTQPGLAFAEWIIIGGLSTFIYVNVRTARQARARRHSAEIARLDTRRRTLESRLQAMQARVEPQFLFNTLAQVKQLYDNDPPLAGKMLDDLIAYLRAALPHLRESSSTLGKEAALARAYLEIVRVRLGERLAFDIEVPADLADARMPPMMLLPLIDHVLVYGLEPSHAGGVIRIETGVGNGRLRLAITDSGAGFVPGGKQGDLDNIGERLFALYGEDATFRLERVMGSGTRAVLEIPYESADRSDR